MFGLDSTGFRRKRYIDVFTTMQANAQGIFGANVNTSENSPLGMFMKVIAFAIGTLWQVAEDVYFSAYKDTATGIQLDRVCQYIGITRKPADRSTGSVIFTGTAGTVIPANTIVKADEILFWTLTAVTVGVDGTVSANIMALEAGTIGNVQAGTINALFKTVSGVSAVINTLATSGGDEAESDDELRTRFDQSISAGGSSTTSSIEAHIYAVQDVIDVDVTENETMTTVDSVPPKAISCFVYGGIDADIAQAIFETKAAGIQAYGSTVVTVTDTKGIGHQIGFSRPTVIPIYVNVTLTKDVAIFPLNGATTIETAIIKYVGGLAADSVEYNGLGVGDDVIYTKIIGLCHSVSGVTDVDVAISTDNVTFITDNIAIASKQVALTDVAKVVIT